MLFFKFYFFYIIFPIFFLYICSDLNRLAYSFVILCFQKLHWMFSLKNLTDYKYKKKLLGNNNKYKC